MNLADRHVRYGCRRSRKAVFASDGFGVRCFTAVCLTVENAGGLGG